VSFFDQLAAEREGLLVQLARPLSGEAAATAASADPSDRSPC
jgi:hypothetical protein